MIYFHYLLCVDTLIRNYDSFIFVHFTTTHTVSLTWLNQTRAIHSLNCKLLVSSKNKKNYLTDDSTKSAEHFRASKTNSILRKVENLTYCSLQAQKEIAA